MRRTKLNRVLSLVLVFIMVLSMVPAGVLAAEPATWTRVEPAAITAEDTVMVTMTNPYGVTYALHTVKASKGNLAKVVTVEGDTVTTDGTADYGWTVTPVEGGYTLNVGELFLYTIDNNNGVRMGDTQAVWAITDGYLATADTAGNTRYLGVYDNNGGDYGAVATPNWRAYKNTTGNTKDQTLGFFKLTTGAVTPDPTEPVPTEPTPTEPVSGTVTLEDGSYVIWESTQNKAASSLAADKGYGYLSAVDKDAAGADERFTLANVGEGRFTLVDAHGRYLYMKGDYNSFNVSADVPAEGHLWTLEDAGEGLVTLKNVLKDKTVAYDTAYNSFGAYPEITETRLSKLTFTAVSGEVTPDPTDPTEPSEPQPTEPEVPDQETAGLMTEAPKNGDTVLIYNAANTAVLGAEPSGKRQSGITAADVNGEIVLTAEMAQLLVTVEDGQYIFTLDGKYLTSAETGNGLSFTDTLTDCGKWTLEAVSGKWIIKNVGANYNGNHNQALEYYNGFTTYGVKETDIYLMDFYMVAGAKQEGVVTELHEGDTVVIFNPANGKALSSEYDGFYNKGTDVTFADGKLSGWSAADVWTVGLGADGAYTFSTADGKMLSMGTSYSSTPLDDVNRDWSIHPAITENCFYIKNVARNTYIEWYADKNNWSSYYNNSNEALFAQMFYLVTGEAGEPGTNKPAAGEQVVLYNLSAQGVLAAEGENQVIENALTTVENGAATPANGGVVFTVEHNGEYYRFFNETYGYLCSNGTGNNAFYAPEASEDADWLMLDGKSGGFFLESRTAKFNGKYSQYLEYYSDSYKTYSMYNVTDYDIYEFFFYPVAEGVNLTGSIVNAPAVTFGTLADAFVGTEYTFSFEVEAVFGVESLSVQVNGTELALTEDHVYTVPAELVKGSALTVTVSGVDTKGVAFSQTATVAVKDEPVILEVAPAAGTQTGADKRPVISVTVANAGATPTVAMTVNGVAVETKLENGVITHTPAADLADGRTTVAVTVTRADGKSVSKTWSFTVGESQYELYFGQLHSHTTYSDGSGSLESALDYIGSLPESANVDFVAFTDHSNYFDSKNAVNPEGALYDMSIATADSQKLWSAYKGAVADFNARQDSVVAIGGYEMTWSGGPGHINTFNTPGIVSRNNSTLNNKTGDAGMKAYYALLSQAEGAQSISQFNHPGTTFGNFSDFAYWDAVIDSRMYLV